MKDGCQLCRGERGGVPGNENRVKLADLSVVVCDYCHAKLSSSMTNRILIEVRGGVVTVCYTDNPHLQVYLRDWDDLEADGAVHGPGVPYTPDLVTGPQMSYLLLAHRKDDPFPVTGMVEKGDRDHHERPLDEPAV